MGSARLGRHNRWHCGTGNVYGPAGIRRRQRARQEGQDRRRGGRGGIQAPRPRSRPRETRIISIPVTLRTENSQETLAYPGNKPCGRGKHFPKPENTI